MTLTSKNVSYLATPLQVKKIQENKTTVTRSHYAPYVYVNYENHMSNYWISTPADDQRHVHKTCSMQCQRLHPTDRGIATFVIINGFRNGASETYWRQSSKTLHYSLWRTVNGSYRSKFTSTLKLLTWYTTATICHHFFTHGLRGRKFHFGLYISDMNCITLPTCQCPWLSS